MSFYLDLDVEQYSLEYITQNFDKRFLSYPPPKESFKIQKELKGLHNQTRIAVAYLQSDYYISNTKYDEYWNSFQNAKEEKEKKSHQLNYFTKIFDQYKELDKNLKLIDPEDLNFFHLEPYLKPLAYHFDAELSAYGNYQNTPRYYARFGIARLGGGIPDHEIKYVLDNIDKLNENLNLYKTNTKPFLKEWELDWHVFLSLCWKLIETGMGEISLYISNTLSKLLNIPIPEKTVVFNRNYPALNNVFSSVDKHNYVRSWCSVLWVQIIASIQLNQKSKAIYYINKLIDIYLNSSIDQSYVLINRIVEASVLLNKLQPSKENNMLARQLFILNCSQVLNEPTECVREKGLVVYDFCKYVLGEDI